MTQAPNGNYLLAAMFDTKMKLYNGISFKEIAQLDHVSQVNISLKEFNRLLIFKEEAYKETKGYSDQLSYHYLNISQENT